MAPLKTEPTLIVKLAGSHHSFGDADDELELEL